MVKISHKLGGEGLPAKTTGFLKSFCSQANVFFRNYLDVDDAVKGNSCLFFSGSP